MKKSWLLPLWLPFLLLLFCYLAVDIQLWVLLSLWSTGLAVHLLLRSRLPSRRGILLSLLFAVLTALSYLGFYPGFSLSMLLAGIPTLLCSLAVLSVAEGTGRPKLISASPLVSLLIALAAGLLLGGINFLLMRGSNSLDIALTPSRLLVCLSPAIYEEIACRAIFLAYCLFSLDGQPPTRFQHFTLWFMMIVPHTLSHGYDLPSTLLLSLLFALPFALLQHKRDLTSAMVSHGLVDAIRFTLFGLGL